MTTLGSIINHLNGEASNNMGKYLVRWLLPGGGHNVDAIMGEADAKEAVRRLKLELEKAGHHVEHGYDETQRRHYALAPLAGVGAIAQWLTGQELQALAQKYDGRVPSAPAAAAPWGALGRSGF